MRCRASVHRRELARCSTGRTGSGLRGHARNSALQSTGRPHRREVNAMRKRARLDPVVMGATITARKCPFMSSGEITTQGRVFCISLPTVGSNRAVPRSTSKVRSLRYRRHQREAGGEPCSRPARRPQPRKNWPTAAWLAPPRVVRPRVFSGSRTAWSCLASNSRTLAVSRFHAPRQRSAAMCLR
jgi:hypothetical protein